MLRCYKWLVDSRLLTEVLLKLSYTSALWCTHWETTDCCSLCTPSLQMLATWLCVFRSSCSLNSSFLATSLVSSDHIPWSWWWCVSCWILIQTNFCIIFINFCFYYRYYSLSSIRTHGQCRPFGANEFFSIILCPVLVGQPLEAYNKLSVFACSGSYQMPEVFWS